VAAVGVSEDPRRPANEDFRFNLDNSWMSYHVSKRRAEEAVSAAAANGLDVVVVNPSLVFGRKAEGYQGAQAMSQPLRSRVVVNGPGGRCVVHVSDVVEGILLALRRGRSGQRYILGGANVSFEEISKTVCREIGIRRLHVPIPALAAECGNKLKGRIRALTGAPPPPIYDGRFCHQYYDSTKAARELGYQPRAFAEIVEECVECLGWRASRQ
jgi:dihydroflavonol-4-reductase